MRPFSSRFFQSAAAAVFGAVATAAIVGGYAVTQADNPSNAIQACVAQKDGAVRIVASPTQCDTKKETATEWSKEGPRGLPGAPGTVGSLGSMVGIPCEVGAAPGIVGVAVAANGDVAIKCNETPQDRDADTFLFPGDDCDDNNPNVHPGVSEIINNGIDEDCSGGDLIDADLDTVPLPLDCNDTNANVHPGATEVYNHLDDDCDGTVDEGFTIQLTATPPTMSFPPRMGTSANTQRFLGVQNTGNAPAENVVVELIRNDGDLYRIMGSGLCGTLNPGSSCVVLVEYEGVVPTVGFADVGDGELIWITSNGAPARTLLDGTP